MKSSLPRRTLHPFTTSRTSAPHTAARTELEAAAMAIPVRLANRSLDVRPILKILQELQSSDTRPRSASDSDLVRLSHRAESSADRTIQGAACPTTSGSVEVCRCGGNEKDYLVRRRA